MTDKDRLKKFGKLLKVERIKNDLTQEQLAELLNVSPRTISLIENGLQHPKYLLVIDLVKVLNIDIKSLLV